jgi:molybdenum cofactor synthesis domain-containing protein
MEARRSATLERMTSEPTAALLIIGAEVLSGKVDDQNGPFLLRALRARGVQVLEIRTIGDAVAAIAAATAALAAAATCVYTTGGIGPTHDDVTVAGIAAAFNRPVVHHPELLQQLSQRYPGQMNAARRKMAEVPQGATVHFGDGSCMPVVQMHNVVILPGVPSLMRACFAQVDRSVQGSPFFSRALLVNAYETAIAASLSAVAAAMPEVAIGSYPRFDAAPYRVKVTIDGRSAQQVDACCVALRNSLGAEVIVGEE